MRLEISGRAIVGSKEPQQDFWRVFNARGENISEKARKNCVISGDGTLVVVADGIGGYAGGEIASRVACEAFADAFFGRQDPIPDRLSLALEAANAAIAEEKQRSPDLKDMGCTLIGVYFLQDRMTFVSVGDSLLLRAREDEIHRVNLDHSYFDYLDRQVIGSNDPSRWAVAVSDTRRRASLTLAVTGDDLNSGEYGHRPQIATRPLLADDVIIVASDGIETLDWVQLQNFLRHLRPTGTMGIADGLIGAVDGIGKNRSYQDNTTIVVIGASSGASLTRVAVPSRAAEAEAAGDGPEPAREFSWRQLVSTQLLLGAIVAAVVLIAALLYWSGAGGDRDPARVQGPPATEPQPQKDGQKSSGGPPPQGGHADAATNRQEPPARQPTAPSPVAPPAEASSRPSDTAGAPAVASQTRPVQPQQPQQPVQTGDRDAFDPNSPRIEVRPRNEFNDVRWVTTNGKSVSPAATDGGQCRQICSDNAQCVAYTWRTDTRSDARCELFSSVFRLENSPKAQSGAREWDNYAWKGEIVQTSADVTRPACFNACLQLSTCGGYTWKKADRATDPPVGRCDLFPPANTEPALQTGAFSGKLRQVNMPPRPSQPQSQQQND